jgi:hypothetical protein
MKKAAIFFTFWGFSLVGAFAQSAFVKTSTDLKEKGKHFLVVDLNQLGDDGQKAAFMELVYSESRIFPVSVVNEKGAWTLCAHASAISEEESREIILALRGKAMGKQSDEASRKKLIQK